MASITNKKKKTTKKGKKASFTILDRIVIVFLVISFLVFITGCGGIGYIMVSTNAKDLNKQIINKEPTTFYADDNSAVGELGMESRENITYKQIPQSTIDAFLAIEDSRYYTHNGFDLPRFISSALTNLRSGSFAQGGSTLTMQTIDNFFMKPVEEQMAKEGKYFSKTQKIQRKLQEIYMSLRLEGQMSKKEIITKYLNQINFGDQARGIQRGAQYFFGKDVEDLTLSESAFLAGCINAPNLYNPYLGYNEERGVNYFKAALDRRNETLQMMKVHGFISDQECALAKSTKLSFALSGKNASSNDPYQNYFKAAAKEVAKMTGKDPATTPMKVYTALDKNAQELANHASSGQLVKLTNNERFQISFTVLNNQTGEIIAVSPGRNDVEDDVYRARFLEVQHQPGSSIKPILDYAPAFDKLGWCTSRMFIDKEIEIDGRKIQNSTKEYYGKVSMERAIAQSLNPAAIQTLQANIDKVGNKDLIKYLKMLGFDDNVANSFNLQYSIGGSNFSVSPTQMAGAYAPLANKGNFIEPHIVKKVVYKDEDGKTIVVKPKKKRVMSEQAAYLTSDLLYKAVNGQYKGMNLMGSLGFGKYPVYGKTGTSDWGEDGKQWNIPETAMKDNWMINYTSEFTIATWSGFDTGVTGDYIDEAILYQNIPGKINKYMLDGITTNKVKLIEKPEGIDEYGGGLIKSEWLPSAAKNNPMTEKESTSTYNSLYYLFTKAKGLNEENYTADSIARLKVAIEQADKVLNLSMANESELQAALKALQDAMDQLQSTVNKSELLALINRASTYSSGSYSAQSFQVLSNAIATARRVYADYNSTQANIQSQIQALNNAINALVAQKDTSALQSAINEAYAKLATMEGDKTALSDAIAAAQAVLNNPNSSQQEVNRQVSTLRSLIAML